MAPCRRRTPFARPVLASASQKTRVQIWLYENTDMRIEGRIIVRACPGTRGSGAAGCCACAHAKLTWQGFDEYMNLVLDEAEEMSIKKKSRKPLGERLARNTDVQTPLSDVGCGSRTCRFHGRSPPALCVGREDPAQGGQHYSHDECRAPGGLSSHHTGRPSLFRSFLCVPPTTQKQFGFRQSSVYSESCPLCRPCLSLRKGERNCVRQLYHPPVVQLLSPSVPPARTRTSPASCSDSAL